MGFSVYVIISIAWSGVKISINSESKFQKWRCGVFPAKDVFSVRLELNFAEPGAF